MQSGFPTDLLHLACCPADAGTLRFTSPPSGAFVTDATVGCDVCAREYRIAAGVLSLLQSGRLHAESALEMQRRDERNELVLDGTQPEWTSAFADATEVRPTIARVAARAGMAILELGCGTGRYTVALVERAACVMAVDVSTAGLHVVRRKLRADAPVALVHADVTEPYAAANLFDRALSTLHSNLPGRDSRLASLRHVAHALKDDGRAVISMHHYGLRNLLLSEPAAGRYADNGIYRYYMRQSEAAREAAPYFSRVRFAYIAASVPGIPSGVLARAAANVPAVRSALGNLFLAVAERPRREPRAAGAAAAASNGAVTLVTRAS